MISTAGIGMTSTRTRNRLVERLREQGISDPRVLEAFRTVPRHLFVDEALASRSYEDTALPIGHGQTISQPFVVGRITSAVIADSVPQKVLEVGSGCGYQAAILATIVPHVYGIERIRPLVARSRIVLRRLQIRNVNLRHGDGYHGWPEQAPFDAIVLSAAPEVIPPPLLDQLADGGKLIAPVGPPDEQKLVEYRKNAGQIEERVLGEVVFVSFCRGTEDD